jgi:hypothetical protein
MNKTAPATRQGSDQEHDQVKLRQDEIEPLKQKRPADWPGMADQRVENNAHERAVRATTARTSI